MPLVRILEIELYTTLLSKARSFGFSDQWIQVLHVKSCLAVSKAKNLLTQGDMGVGNQ